MENNKKLQTVSFEQAKKLQKDDFHWYCNAFYNLNGKLRWNMPNENHNRKNKTSQVLSAPSVSLALQFYREEKKISCGVYPVEGLDTYGAKYKDGNTWYSKQVGTYDQTASELLDEIQKL